MLQRHKVPTIFNIYMLDVICCALGCVILLWQVAHQDAETHTEDARQQKQQYEKAHADLLSASSDVTQLQTALASWQKKHQLLSLSLSESEKNRAGVQTSLRLREDELKKLRDDLEKLLASHKKTEAELTGTLKLNADLLLRMAFAEKKIDAQKLEIDLTTKASLEKTALLKLSDSEISKLKSLLDALKDENKVVQNKLKLAELQIKVREQDLENARKESGLGGKDLLAAKELITTLTRERDQWKDKAASAAKGAALDKDAFNKRIAALQAEAEQRFAGIPLTGENVIFLLDISGSMIMKDEATEDPDKWPFLCETLMKLMKSIPTLQRFQVILFSDKTHYLFGNRDYWLKYEGPDTARMTRDAMRRVKVEGGTNMHEAFDEAFRYRKNKLDTIYLFSDGLPNLGEGLPPGLKNPTEAQRSFHLGRFVREKIKNEWNRPQEGLKDVRINAVGFFFESPDVGAFLWAMAREHRGAFVGLR